VHGIQTNLIQCLTQGLSEDSLNANPPLYILSAGDYVAIPYGQSVNHPSESFRPTSVVAAVKCAKCGSISTLIDREPKQTEAHVRQMGMEECFVASCIETCSSCGLDLRIDAQFVVYAHEWTFSDEECSNCEIANVLIDPLVEEICRFTSVDDEFEDWIAEPTGCAVFVEGDDDKAVIRELLQRQAKQSGGDLRSLRVHIFKGLGGGKERAAESAKYVADIAKRVSSGIEYLIILDGDTREWAKSQNLVKADRIFVLSKKEIDSYLLVPRAIASACRVDETEVKKRLRGTPGEGKEELEQLLRTYGFRPTPDVKKVIARHLDDVPHDFVELMERIQLLRGAGQ